MAKLYTVLSTVTIPSIGITGPITTPIELDEREAVRLVRTKNAVIYQHNPDYPKEKVRVTEDNFHSIIFKKTKKDAALEKIQGFDKASKEVKIDITKKKGKHHYNAPDEGKKEPKIVSVMDTVEAKDEKPSEVNRPDAFVSTKA